MREERLKRECRENRLSPSACSVSLDHTREDSGLFSLRTDISCCRCMHMCRHLCGCEEGLLCTLEWVISSSGRSCSIYTGTNAYKKTPMDVHAQIHMPVHVWMCMWDDDGSNICLCTCMWCIYTCNGLVTAASQALCGVRMEK